MPATQVVTAFTGLVSACTFGATELMYRTCPSASDATGDTAVTPNAAEGNRVWIQVLESLLTFLVKGAPPFPCSFVAILLTTRLLACTGNFSNVFCPRRGFRNALAAAALETNLLHMPLLYLGDTFGTETPAIELPSETDLFRLEVLRSMVRRIAKYGSDVDLIVALCNLVHNRVRVHGSFLQRYATKCYRVDRAN